MRWKGRSFIPIAYYWFVVVWVEQIPYVHIEELAIPYLTLAQTFVAIINCVLAMLHYPDVMHRAHEELDTIVGRERAPTFSDKDSLPYIQAIVYETLRWRPPLPLGKLLVDYLNRKISGMLMYDVLSGIPYVATEVSQVLPSVESIYMMVHCCRAAGTKDTLFRKVCTYFVA